MHARGALFLLKRFPRGRRTHVHAPMRVMRVLWRKTEREGSGNAGRLPAGKTVEALFCFFCFQARYALQRSLPLLCFLILRPSLRVVFGQRERVVRFLGAATAVFRARYFFFFFYRFRALSSRFNHCLLVEHAPRHEHLQSTTPQAQQPDLSLVLLHATEFRSSNSICPIIVVLVAAGESVHDGSNGYN